MHVLNVVNSLAEMFKAAKAWSIWEGRTSKLMQDPWDVVKDKFGSDKFSLAFARIENHYFTNKVGTGFCIYD